MSSTFLSLYSSFLSLHGFIRILSLFSKIQTIGLHSTILVSSIIRSLLLLLSIHHDEFSEGIAAAYLRGDPLYCIIYSLLVARAIISFLYSRTRLLYTHGFLMAALNARWIDIGEI